MSELSTSPKIIPITVVSGAPAGEKQVGNDQAEHAVAEEFEALVVAVGPDRTGMGQRGLEQTNIPEGMAGSGFHQIGQSFTSRALQSHQFTKWNMRDRRTSDGHFQISSGLALPAIEKKTMLARPTRFSAGT